MLPGPPCEIIEYPEEQPACATPCVTGCDGCVLKEQVQRAMEKAPPYIYEALRELLLPRARR